jgi:hypothetical protein
VELFSESNVKEITSKFRELKIPCDAIYLDIDYMEGFDVLLGTRNIFRSQENGCRISKMALKPL